MNPHTGQIFSDFEVKDLQKLFYDGELEEDVTKDFVRVDEINMTQRQKTERKVSLKDHRSKLGKQLTSVRSDLKKKKKAKRKISKKSRKKNR